MLMWDVCPAQLLQNEGRGKVHFSLHKCTLRVTSMHLLNAVFFRKNTELQR